METGPLDTIWKKTNPAKFGLIWFSGFRWEKVNIYDGCQAMTKTVRKTCQYFKRVKRLF